MKRKRVLLLLCILNCTLQLFAQQINVQGVVYDPSGETVPGANVSMKSNPAVGTVTDIDGNFSLKAFVGDVLVFTFIGYALGRNVSESEQPALYASPTKE